MVSRDQRSESGIEVGTRWEHFKGGKYIITGMAWDAEGDDLVERVLYRSGEFIGSGMVFSRTVANFLGPVPERADARFKML